MNTLVDKVKSAVYQNGYIVVIMERDVEIRFPVAGNPRLAKGTRPMGAGRASQAGRIFWGLPLDMDLASAGDLERISGIGLKRARRIVRWRREHGPVEDPGRLEAIPGIGPGTVELLKNALQGGQTEPEQAGMQDAMKY